ncbi:MAG: helix-turn-helix domain-containing protein [Haloferacaceae archaeon]
MSVYAEIDLPVTALSGGRSLLAHPDVHVEFERIVPTGSFTHYLWVVGEGRTDVVDDLRTDPSVKSVAVLDELPERVLVRVTSARSENPLFDAIEETDVVFAGARGTSEGWSVDLHVPDRDALATFYEVCRDREVDWQLRGIHEPGFPTGDADYDLSEIQRETLETAFDAGYFEVPRGATITDLSDRLGVSEQAVSERLRRGLARFLAATVGDAESERSDADRTP